MTKLHDLHDQVDSDYCSILTYFLYIFINSGDARMTSKFDDFDHAKFADSSEDGTEIPTDCFELLSAYIDGELSAAEKSQVQRWLDQDPKIKNLYTQLLTLQGNMQLSLAPPSDKSVAEITTGVFKSIDRRRQRRLVFTGGAIAASILATITALIPGITPSGLRIAEIENTGNLVSTPIMLAVAVNKPAINIPKAINGYQIEFHQLEEN